LTILSAARSFVFLLNFLLICISAANVYANDLLDQHFKAIGGKGSLMKVETVYRSGTVKGSGVLGEFAGDTAR